MLAIPNLPQSLAMRLDRGDIEMYRRMDRLREPCRRAAAILFADLEASGELSDDYRHAPTSNSSAR
jgi:class 3 adenylate cyclase